MSLTFFLVLVGVTTHVATQDFHRPVYGLDGGLGQVWGFGMRTLSDANQQLDPIRRGTFGYPGDPDTDTGRRREPTYIILESMDDHPNGKEQQTASVVAQPALGPNSVSQQSQFSNPTELPQSARSGPLSSQISNSNNQGPSNAMFPLPPPSIMKVQQPSPQSPPVALQPQPTPQPQVPVPQLQSQVGDPSKSDTPPAADLSFDRDGYYPGLQRGPGGSMSMMYGRSNTDDHQGMPIDYQTYQQQRGAGLTGRSDLDDLRQQYGYGRPHYQILDSQDPSFSGKYNEQGTSQMKDESDDQKIDSQNSPFGKGYEHIIRGQNYLNGPGQGQGSYYGSSQPNGGPQQMQQGGYYGGSQSNGGPQQGGYYGNLQSNGGSDDQSSGIPGNAYRGHYTY